MDQEFQVRVYNDRRICVTAPILRAAWSDRNGGIDRPLPKQVFVRTVGDGRHRPVVHHLSWDSHPDSQSFDLSVRERVLFGSNIPGLCFPVQIVSRPRGKRLAVEDLVSEAAIGDILILADRGVQAPKKRPGKRSTKSKEVRPNGSSALQKLEREMDWRRREVQGEVIRRLFPHMTLAEVMKYCPDLTVGDLIGG